MSILSWNCRGLGNPTSVQVLVDLIHSRKPNIVFFIETFTRRNRLNPIKTKVGFSGFFVVDNVGHRGGLALMWNDMAQVDIKSFSNQHIDTEVSLDGGTTVWRFTGFYGIADRSKRRDSWRLLKNLASHNDKPWVVMGDFNDLLSNDEKKGGTPQPSWLIKGFKEAVESSGLRDLGFDGHQFTWERARGSPNWVSAKLDRIFVSDSWVDLFRGARGTSLQAAKSDHLPLFLKIESEPRSRMKRKNYFENLWLKDNLCREVVVQSWSKSGGQDLLTRIEKCGKAVWEWGKDFSRNFHRRIEFWKRRMEKFRSRADHVGINNFYEAQYMYLVVLK